MFPLDFRDVLRACGVKVSSLLPLLPLLLPPPSLSLPPSLLLLSLPPSLPHPSLLSGLSLYVSVWSRALSFRFLHLNDLIASLRATLVEASFCSDFSAEPQAHTDLPPPFGYCIRLSGLALIRQNFPFLSPPQPGLSCLDN